MNSQQDTAGRWDYPTLEVVIVLLGLEEVETYVLHRHNIISQYIATHLILDLCLEAEQQLGARVARQWWEKGGLDLDI